MQMEMFCIEITDKFQANIKNEWQINEREKGREMSRKGNSF